MTHESASWPSAKMSASTATRSPTVRLLGNRPASTSGLTLSMATPRRAAALGAAALAEDCSEGLPPRRLTGTRATDQIVPQKHNPPPPVQFRGEGWGEGPEPIDLSLTC